MEEIAIIYAKRTAFAKFGGAFTKLSALDLINELGKDLNQNIDLSLVDNVYIGNVLQAGNGQNIARQFALHLGLKPDAMATTINAVCGSGMQSIILGTQSLLLNDSKMCIVGGVESMSNAPYLLKNHRFGTKYGNDLLIDSLHHDGLYDHFSQIDMIQTAENVAEKFNITKEMQDLFAYKSHIKAIKALQTHQFKDEILPIHHLHYDEGIRKTIDLEKVKSLPAINKTISAANASGLSDGACLLVLMRKSDALKQGFTPLAIIQNYVTSGYDNTLMGFAPYYAIQKLLKKENRSINDYDIIEMTEAFAAQSLAIIQELNIDSKKLNCSGGSIALGHPLGASGAKIVVSAIHELKRQNKKSALATLCIGGGNAIALSIRNYEGD